MRKLDRIIKESLSIGPLHTATDRAVSSVRLYILDRIATELEACAEGERDVIYRLWKRIDEEEPRDT